VRERRFAPSPSEQPRRRAGKALRILAVAPTSFFADYGCHVRILGQLRLLQECGHQVHLCTYHSGSDVPGLTIRRTLPLPWRRGLEIGSSPHKLLYDLLLGPLILQQALRLRPHLIHAYLHEGTLLTVPTSRLLNVPVVFDLQGSLTGEMIDHRSLKSGSCAHHALRWLEGTIDRWPTVITASSHNAANSLLSDFRIAPSCIRVVCDGVDGTIFRPGLLSFGERKALLEKLGISPHKRIVVYLGLLVEYQGISPLLRAAACLRVRQPDVHFLIMGFPQVHRYQQLAQKLEVADVVTFPGRIPYEMAPRYLAVGDVAVAPKLSATEGSGKLPNYMAMALPTVASDSPVSREYLGPAGCYASPDDAQAVAGHIEALLAKQEEARARGLQLRERALRLYSWRVVRGQLEAAYSQALNAGAAA